METTQKVPQKGTEGTKESSLDVVL